MRLWMLARIRGQQDLARRSTINLGTWRGLRPAGGTLSRRPKGGSGLSRSVRVVRDVSSAVVKLQVAIFGSGGRLLSSHRWQRQSARGRTRGNWRRTGRSG